MYTAMILVCLSDHIVDINNCLVLSNQYVHKTEVECVNSIADFLNNEMFYVMYNDYNLENFSCYEWFNNSGSKI
jgi:hypothetical protein